MASSSNTGPSGPSLDNVKLLAQGFDQLTKELRETIRIEREKQAHTQELILAKKKRIHDKHRMDSDKKYSPEQLEEDLETPVDGDIKLGSRVFMVQCASCHGLQAYTHQAANAPTLGLIHNRLAGSEKHFFGYSQALIGANIRWTTRNLYRFMTNPKNLFISPIGCSLYKQPLLSDPDRADLIAFITSFSKELSTSLKIQDVRSKGYDLVQSEIYTEERYKDIQRKRQQTHFTNKSSP